jgi:hypothetical protein
MFKNECDLDEAKVNWILKCANNFKSDLHWKGLNLRPAFIRYLYYAMMADDTIVDSQWLEKRLSSQVSFNDILLELEFFEKSWKSKAKNIPGLLFAQYKIKWLGHNLNKNKKNKPLIVARHWKHVSYLKKSQLFNTLDPNWLVDSPQMAKEIGLATDDSIVPQIRPFRVSKSLYPLNLLHDLANGLKISLKKIAPSAIFVVEGDAPHHSLLAEIGYQLNIPVYCFQWGFFHPLDLITNFGEMRFNKFLSWGPMFEKQLKPYNSKLDFISFGHLTSNSQSQLGNKIIFLSQFITSYITKSDQELFVKLAKSLAERFPNQVIWRPHPSDLDNGKELLELKDSKVCVLDPRESLTNQLQNSMLAVGIGSSSLIDALHCGVIPISFNTTCMKNYPFPLSEKGIGFEFKSFDDALQNITDLMTNQERIGGIKNKIAMTHSTIFTKTELRERMEIIQQLCKNE